MNSKSKWIWILLVIAVGGVLYARNAGRQRTDRLAEMPAASGSCAVNGGCLAQGPSLEPASAATNTPALPRLVDLGSGKCIPCKVMAPILADLKQTYAGRMDVTFIDVWEKPNEAKKYGINIIPTQIFYDAQGKERFRHEGFFGKEDILAKWKELGVALGGEAE